MDDIIIIDNNDVFQDELLCNVCFAEFLDREDLELHIKQIHLNDINRSRACMLCTNIFSHLEEYALHLRNVHLSYLKSCKHCTRLFETSIQVQEHEKKHNAAVLYPKVSCSQCESVLDSINVRNHEIEKHINSDDGLILTECLPVLSSLLCMNIHDFLTATLSSLPYACRICNNLTTDVNVYIQHLKDNHKRPAYTCNDCCNVYQHKCKLQDHIMQAHSSDRLNINDSGIQCPQCKHSIQVSAFQSHITRCTGMSCKSCKLYFKSLEEYNNHRMTEHNRKLPTMQVCIYCQRQMVGVDQMRKHIERTHGKDKHLYKYPCLSCKKIFKHPKLLFGHFYSTHKDIHPYTCKICNKTFRLRKTFTLHIKMTHKSIGFVEFNENYHVYFTDKKSEKLSNRQTVLEDTNYESELNDTSNPHSDIMEDESIKLCIIKSDNVGDNLLEQSREELFDIKPNIEPIGQKKNKTGESIENIHTYKNKLDTKNISKSVKKLKRKKNLKRKWKINFANDGSDTTSDDSDIPLQKVSRKLKKQKSQIRKLLKRPTFSTKLSKNKKFICSTCNRNCYTYQNHLRHEAMHTKNMSKVCIKCFAQFDSVRKLKEHIKKEHSSSQLTETLKKLLEKRKITDAKDTSKEIPHSTNDLIPQEEETLFSREKFKQTIKKIGIDRSVTTEVTMKLIDKDQTSVKKYFENFIPDNNEVKITVIKDVLQNKQPMIKLTKFTPESPVAYQACLKMPVKFTDSLKEQCKISIKLVSSYQPPAITFYSVKDNNLADTDYNHDTYYNDDFEPDEEHKDDIPEVAHEVMLEGVKEENTVVHTVNLKNQISLPNVQIAHLSSEAPFYKISKIDLKKGSPFSLKPEQIENKNNVECNNINLSLPNGKKLVNVNPFEHLLNKKNIDDLKFNHNKNSYYKPRITNAAAAIVTALAKLDKKQSMKANKRLSN